MLGLAHVPDRGFEPVAHFIGKAVEAEQAGTGEEVDAQVASFSAADIVVRVGVGGFSGSAPVPRVRM